MEPDVQDKTPEVYNCTEGLHWTWLTCQLHSLFMLEGMEQNWSCWRVKDGKRH